MATLPQGSIIKFHGFQKLRIHQNLEQLQNSIEKVLMSAKHECEMKIKC